MFRAPLIRRVSIYLVLSSTAVCAVNLLEVEQQNAYQVYIPLFIGIYVLSRWIDSKISAGQLSKVDEQDAATTQTRSDRGFKG